MAVSYEAELFQSRIKTNDLQMTWYDGIMVRNAEIYFVESLKYYIWTMGGPLEIFQLMTS